MSKIYCGNNLLDIDLVKRKKILGTRYQCLKKGVGKGINMPLSKKYGYTYLPIDNRKIYCGNNPVLPPTYDSMGNLSQCLQKGIGVGMRKKALQERPRFPYRRVYVPIVFLVISSALYTLLYFQKPKFVRKPGEDKKIDWNKFLSFYIPVVVILFIATVIFVY